MVNFWPSTLESRSKYSISPLALSSAGAAAAGAAAGLAGAGAGAAGCCARTSVGDATKPKAWARRRIIVASCRVRGATRDCSRAGPTGGSAMLAHMLLVFHRVLVSTAIAFCGVMVWFEVARWHREGGAAALLVGAACLAVAAALAW